MGEGSRACAPQAAPAPRRFRIPRWAARIARFCLLMVAVSAVTFALVGSSPIDPLQANVGQAALARMSPEKRAQMEAHWGTDVPVAERYLAWAAGALRGDLGESLRYNRPVAQVIAERAGASLALMGASWALSGVLGLVMGIAAGARRGSVLDRLVRGYCYLVSSTPVFWLGLVALTVFSVRLGWFPVGFAQSIGGAGSGLADRLHHLALPVLTLSVTGVGNVALHTREKTIDVLASPYARFARARGERGWTLLRRHGLRNLVIPAITLQMSQVSEVLGGSVLVEQVFSYPGLGQAAVTAGTGGDAPLLVGIALASAAIVCAGNAVADALAALVDPRLSRAPRARVGREEVGHAPVAQGGPLAAAPASVAPRPAAAASPSPAEVPLELHAPARRGAGNRRRLLALAIACAAGLVAVVVAGRALMPLAVATDFSAKALAPSAAHPFGTDWMGRDMLARTLGGLSISVLVGLAAAVASSVVAFALAAVAALGGPRADAAVTWFIDLVMGVPHIVLLVLISYALGRGALGVTVGVALTHWTGLARLLRAEIAQVRTRPYIEASRALGVRGARLAMRHMVPAVLPQYLVGLVLLFPHAILHEASVTFLGFGLSPDLPAIGVILSESMGYLSAGMWWLAVLPGAALVGCVLLFAALGGLARRLMTPEEVQA